MLALILAHKHHKLLLVPMERIRLYGINNYKHLFNHALTVFKSITLFKINHLNTIYVVDAEYPDGKHLVAKSMGAPLVFNKIDLGAFFGGVMMYRGMSDIEIKEIKWAGFNIAELWCQFITNRATSCGMNLFYGSSSVDECYFNMLILLQDESKKAITFNIDNNNEGIVYTDFLHYLMYDLKLPTSEIQFFRNAISNMYNALNPYHRYNIRNLAYFRKFKSVIEECPDLKSVIATISMIYPEFGIEWVSVIYDISRDDRL